MIRIKSLHRGFSIAEAISLLRLIMHLLWCGGIRRQSFTPHIICDWTATLIFIVTLRNIWRQDNFVPIQIIV